MTHPQQPRKQLISQLILQLILQLIQVMVAQASVAASAAACSLSTHPASIHSLMVGRFTRLQLNCSCCEAVAEANESLLVAKFLMANSLIAAVTAETRRQKQPHTPLKRTCNFGEACTFAELLLGSDIFVEANNVGRTVVKVMIIAWNSSSWKDVLVARRDDSPMPQQQLLAEYELPVVTVRAERLIDHVFDISIGCVACVLAMCMGCVTQLRELRPQFARPLALAAALIVQHLLMPPVALGLSHAFSLQREIGFGLVALATVPGGGMAHLAVFLMDGDRQLSAAVSLLNAMLNVGLCPLWMSLLSAQSLIGEPHHQQQQQQQQLHVLGLVHWLVAVLASQLLGCVLCTWKQSAAESLLNWIGRPLLLLAAILLVTLGIYINHYAIDHLDTKSLMCALTFIAVTFVLGGVSGIAAKQSKPRRKAMAAEASCFASLAAIPAIRAACTQPTADLATVLPLAACILAPTPIVLYLISHKAKVLLQNFVHRRKEKHSRQYSIVSSLAKMAEDVAVVSAPIAIEEAREAAAAAVAVAPVAPAVAAAAAVAASEKVTTL